MKNIYIGTGWKMNKSVVDSCDYIDKMVNYIESNNRFLKKVEIFILPNFLALDACMKIIKQNNSTLKLGAQNCFWEDSGAFTGEISPLHLKDLGITYVEIGHAERRKIFNETDEMISKKLLAALKNKIKPILCIGEKDYQENIEDAFNFLEKQLLEDLDKIDVKDLDNIIIAYEPVWAIGADFSAPFDYIEKILAFLREVISKNYGNIYGDKQIIIYGGSVTPQSAKDLLKLRGNNGIFIGRAALNLDYFINMIKMAASSD